jgi:hypothetical protein
VGEPEEVLLVELDNMPVEYGKQNKYVNVPM